MSFMINRRRFLQSASASLAFSALGARGVEIVNQKPRRVGLIGAGWYGKSDLCRLIQVAPVEVVSICDPDKQMLAAKLHEFYVLNAPEPAPAVQTPSRGTKDEGK